MADDFVQVAPDGTGKKIDNTTVTTGAGSVERQRVSIADAAATNNATVKAASTAVAAADSPLAVGLHPTSPLPAGTNVIGHVIVDSGAITDSGTVTANAGTGPSTAWKVDLSATAANTTAVKVDNSAVTQPVSAAALPLPSGAATVAKQPALGTAGTASADVISIQGIASMTAVKVDGSGVTQPVSGTVTANAGTGPASAWKVDLSATAANATAVKVDGSAVTQPISGTVTTTPPANASTNVAQIGGAAAPAATAKGTQGATAIPTQDLKDAGRLEITLFLDAVAGITTEALATMQINKGGVAQTAATSYTVTAGKTLRITGLHTSVKNTSTVASDSRARVRQAASGIAVTSPIILLNEAGSPAAIANSVGTDDTTIYDGHEVAGGQQIAISHIESATTNTVSVILTAYEY